MAAFSDVKNTQDVTEQKLSTAELLFRQALAMQLQPNWVIPQKTFAVYVDGREEYVNATRSALNSHKSASLAKNKYLTRRILERHEITNIPFLLPQTLEQATAFLSTHQTIIAKPINGSGSRDIHIITTGQQLATLNIRKYIIEKYITGAELRYLILDGRVIAVHQSDYGESVAHDRPLKRISFPENQWNEQRTKIAIRATHVLGLRFAAVDFLVDSTGTTHLLEVNSAPGLKWFHAPTSGPIVDVAGKFLNAIFYPTAISEQSQSITSGYCSHCIARQHKRDEVV